MPEKSQSDVDDDIQITRCALPRPTMLADLKRNRDSPPKIALLTRSLACSLALPTLCIPAQPHPVLSSVIFGSCGICCYNILLLSLLVLLQMLLLPMLLLCLLLLLLLLLWLLLLLLVCQLHDCQRDNVSPVSSASPFFVCFLCFFGSLLPPSAHGWSWAQTGAGAAGGVWGEPGGGSSWRRRCLLL